MVEPARFPYLQRGGVGPAALMPYMPIELGVGEHTDSATALLDTGASVNVLPFELGVRLGANWDEQTVPLLLTGNLARYEARALFVEVRVAQLNPVRLAFAWTQAKEIPVILGQVNFFMEYDVCFFRAQSQFEVRPKS